jgi:DNA-binding MarR family transcriptional regulator
MGIPNDEFGKRYFEVIEALRQTYGTLELLLRSEFGPTITPPQVMVIYYIGDQTITVSELRRRGYYLGSNATHNLAKLISDGFIENTKSNTDRRVTNIKLTVKGKKLCIVVAQFFANTSARLEATNSVHFSAFVTAQEVLLAMNRNWAESSLYHRLGN